MLNLTGKQFGRLTVIEKTRERAGKSIVWKCICLCGNLDARISARDLISNPRKGCGVCRDSEHPLYSIWRGIVSRCEDRADKNYGGRGISICKEWREEFLIFVRDVGTRPSAKHSIDRIDVNGNYEPNNVRWATPLEQARNKRPIVIGLTDEEIVDIYSSKESVTLLMERYNIADKTVRNIKARTYSERASNACIKYLLRNITKPQAIPS